MTCPHCGCNDKATNDARGETVCTGCGRVLSESVMVDQLTFGGGGKMHGHIIDTKSKEIKGFAALYGRREDSEIVLSRGFNNMERVASRLNMSSSLIEAAKRLYRLALHRSFTSGRNNYYVVSACLYAVCRREKSAQMLIDFSDALMVPVKVLAQIFMKLTRSLCLQVPCVDPSLFMERFAQSMKLGPKASKVALTGVRLVQSMTRDWLVTGRRPLGLCAASLLIAARYHGCRLHADDVNDIFRIAASTVEKRLREFSETSIANVAVKDFEATDLSDLPHRELPPCVTNPTKKRRLALMNESSPYFASTSSPVHTMMTGELAAIEDVGGKQIQSESWIESHLQSQAVDGKSCQPLTYIPLTEVTTVETACSEDLYLGEVTDMATNYVEAVEKRIGSLRGHDDLSGVLKTVGAEARSLVESLVELDAITPKIVAEEIVSRVLDIEVAEETLSDVDEELVNEIMLDDEEKEAKTLIWDDLMKDVMPMVELRAKERRAKQIGKSNGRQLKRREPLAAMESAESSTKAALRRATSAFDTKMNEAAVSELFSI